MSKYEQKLDLITNDEQLLSGKAQIDYINELEDLCQSCDRVIIHSEIARTAFSHRKYMEKFAARRGFTISFGIKENSFVFERIGENKANVAIDTIIKNHKEAACQKTTKNKKAISKLRGV